VRTLKNPPEIWDLVHETPPHFNPGGAFVARLTSNKTNLVLLTLGVMFISGLVFAVITLRGGRTPFGAAAQVQEERGATQTVPASQADATASAPVNAEVNTSPGAANSVDNTPPRPPDPQPTDPHADNPASTVAPFTSSIHRTGMTINSISKRTASFAGTTAVLSGNKRVTVAPGRQDADKPRSASGESETAAAHDSIKPQTPRTADVKESDEKISSDSASAKKRSNTTLSPQLIAPPTTSSAPKAKVIRWP
jgi:hypothetical protein